MKLKKKMLKKILLIIMICAIGITCSINDSYSLFANDENTVETTQEVQENSSINTDVNEEPQQPEVVEDVEEKPQEPQNDENIEEKEEVVKEVIKQEKPITSSEEPATAARSLLKMSTFSTGPTNQRYFSFNGNTLTGFVNVVPGVSEPAPRDIVIPETYLNTSGETVEVLNIGESAFAGKGTYIDSIKMNNNLKTIGANSFQNLFITGIAIPNSVTSIGTSAFNNCSNLTKVTLGSGLQTIGIQAFQETKISEIVIPDSVTNIGRSAFNNCSSLTKVTLGSGLQTIGNYAFRSTKISEIVIPDSVTSIGEDAFNNCIVLTKVTLGSGLQTIGASAFSYTKINEITIPDSVTSIGDSAVSNCSNLTKVTLGSGVKTIGIAAFQGTKISEITIPDSVTSIGGNAFRYCSNLTKVTLGSGVKTIGIAAFQGTKISEITIPDSVTSIGGQAFYAISTLTKVTLGSGLKTMGNDTFRDTNISEITIPDSVTSIDNFAFGYCSSLTKVTLGSGLQRIDNYAFYETKIREIVIPDSVTSIGHFAFGGYSSLTKVTLGSGVKTIGDSAFQGAKISEIEIPDSVTSIGEGAFSGSDGLLINIDKNFNSVIGKPWGAKNAKVKWKDDASYAGHFYYKDGKIMGIKNFPETDCNSEELHKGIGILKIPNEINGERITEIEASAFRDAGISEVILPEIIEKIGVAAFSNCSTLTKVTLGSGLKTIGGDAFQDTKISEITIPDSVTSIGDNAFRYCSNLTKVTLGSGLKTIGNYAFQRAKISEIIIPDSVTRIGDFAFDACSTLTKVTLGSGLQTIDRDAFRGTKISEITIPDSVTNIGSSAFHGCSTLTKVTLGSGLQTIGGDAFRGTKISEIVIPDSVTSIGDFAFGYCSSLTKVTLGSGLQTIGDYAFVETLISEIVIPDSVTSIGDNAFQDCSNLTKVTLGSGVKTIGIAAFQDTKISEITIPDSVTSIGGGAFSSCSSLTKVTIGSGLKTIGIQAFQETKISEIVIPDSVTNIGHSAFQDCSDLTSVTLGSGVQMIGGSAFVGTQISEITIPDSVTSIDDSAFGGCSSLTKVTLGSGLKTIGRSAFVGTQISGILIPSSVTSIANNSFDGTLQMIRIDQLRNGASIRMNEPWGATSASVYYKNEYINMKYMIGKEGHKRFINYDFEAGDLAGLIFTIENPDGTNVGSVSNKVYSGSYEVSQNGTYRFEAQSSANKKFPYTVVVDDIGKVSLDGNDISIRKELLDVSTIDELLSYGDVVGLDIDTNTKLSVSVDKTIDEIKSALQNNGDSIQITVTTENDLGVKESKKITITLDDSAHIAKFYDGDDLLKVQSIADGDHAIDWNPNKKAATFDTWFTDKACTTEYNFNKDVTGDIDLYAKWDWFNYNVAYTTGFDDLTIANKTNVTVNDKGLIPDSISKKGYVFKGWDYNGEAITKDTKLEKILKNEGDGSTFTLTASWEKETYLVNFAFVGNAPIDMPDPQSITYLDKASTPSMSTYENWQFDGWYQDFACTTKFDFNTSVDKAMTIYGKWTYYKSPEDGGNPVVKPDPNPGEGGGDSNVEKPDNGNTDINKPNDKEDSDITTDVDGKLDKDQIDKGLSVDDLKKMIHAYDKNGDVDYKVLSATYNSKTGKYDVKILLENGESRTIHIPVDQDRVTSDGLRDIDCWIHWLILLIALGFISYSLISINRAHRQEIVRKRVRVMRFVAGGSTLLLTTIIFLLCVCDLGLWLYLTSDVILIIFLIWFMYQDRHLQKKQENKDAVSQV